MTFTKVMVIGGINAEFKVEVIDLNGKSCQSYPDFPIAKYSVGTFINDKALVCGGFTSKKLEKDCYSLSIKVWLYHLLLILTLTQSLGAM